MNGNTASTNEIPYDLSNEKVVYKGRWLGVKEVDFAHKKTSHKGVWQTAFRTSTPKYLLKLFL